jgi:D-amino-acid oxidase
MQRRDFFKVAAAITLSACLRQESRAQARPSLAAVKVSPDRIIRTVVGLRPFRPSGFVVRTEKVDDKLIVHNYGHGGAGITLSWGTAQLAVELARQSEARRFAVLGCGAVGLATARLLQSRGGNVTICARDLPPNTTSNIAGGQWWPVTVADQDRRTSAFNDQLTRAAHFAYRYYQDLVGDEYGVHWRDNYLLRDTPFHPGGELALAGLVTKAADLLPWQHPFAAPFVRRFTTMMIEPAQYLRALTRDVLQAGGNVVVRELTDRRSLLELEEPVVLNCTGLGSHALFGDTELTPIKGQLTVLLPQPEVDYAVLQGNLYMFPRRDGIVLGGTHERGNWSLEPNPTAAAGILEGHARLFAPLVR